MKSFTQKIIEEHEKLLDYGKTMELAEKTRAIVEGMGFKTEKSHVFGGNFELVSRLDWGIGESDYSLVLKFSRGTITPGSSAQFDESGVPVAFRAFLNALKVTETECECEQAFGDFSPRVWIRFKLTENIIGEFCY